MTSPQGPAREERWKVSAGVDTLGERTAVAQRGEKMLLDQEIADYLNALERERDHLLDRSTEFEMQLVQAEAERNRYRQALEKVRQVAATWPWYKVQPSYADKILTTIDEALALSSAGRETT